MTNEHEHSRIDAAIDAAVTEMMRMEPRRDLDQRVLRALNAPAPAAWWTWRPALTAAALASLVLVLSVSFFRTPSAPHAVPSIPVTDGVPSLQASIPAPTAPAVPPAATAARTPATTASSEEIFGNRRGEVSATSVRASSRVRIVLRLQHGSAGTERSEGLTVLLVPGETRSAKSTASNALAVDAKTALLPSGDVNLMLQVRHPLERALTVTLTPGKATRILNGVDDSGRPFTLEATATIVRASVPQR